MKEDDELWLMIDVDRWGDKQLAVVSSQAGQNKFQMAVSNRCFETWLYLHHDYLGHEHISSGYMKKKLAVILGGYDSSRLDLKEFKNVDAAITRAKTLDVSTDDRWLLKIGTHVYKIVEKVK